eukprot:363443-Chlamydomonas_euryale.AAC.8
MCNAHALVQDVSRSGQRRLCGIVGARGFLASACVCRMPPHKRVCNANTSNMEAAHNGITTPKLFSTFASFAHEIMRTSTAYQSIDCADAATASFCSLHVHYSQTRAHLCTIWHKPLTQQRSA